MTDLRDGLDIRPMDAGYGARIFGLAGLPDDRQRAAIQAALDAYGLISIDGEKYPLSAVTARIADYAAPIVHFPLRPSAAAYEDAIRSAEAAACAPVAAGVVDQGVEPRV